MLLACRPLPRALTAARPTRPQLLTSCRLVVMKRGETPEERKARKEAIKEQKAAQRARREGLLEEVGRKPCTLCSEMKDTLIRCQVDASARWHMVCGRCWREASGGVVDGDSEHPHYRYGGLWRNLHKPK